LAKKRVAEPSKPLMDALTALASVEVPSLPKREIEYVPVSPRSPAEHFAIEAIAAHFKDAEDIPLGTQREVLEVEFRVNGVSLPFAKTIAESYRRMEADIERRAFEFALEKTSMRKLFSDIEAAEWRIRETLGSIFGIDNPHEDRY
jgi:hypothetical protein